MSAQFGAMVRYCRAAGTLLLLPLAACQPALRSQLPAGDAGLQAIRANTQPVAPGAYLLRPGDHVAVSVYQEADLSLPDVPIDEAGAISVPLLGTVHAAGRNTTDIAAEIQQAYGARYLRDPKVTVTLREARPRMLSVEGQVTRPGQFAVEPGNTLLTAVALAGSPTESAKLDEVLVFRNIDGQRLGGRFDLTAIRAGRAVDPPVLPGDVIVVGYSAVRGIYRDFLQAAPLLGIFTRF